MVFTCVLCDPITSGQLRVRQFTEDINNASLCTSLTAAAQVSLFPPDMLTNPRTATKLTK